MTKKQPPKLSRKEGLVILAAILAVAIIVTVILIPLGNETPQEINARALAVAVELASQNAHADDTPYGLNIDAHRYQFYTFDGTHWQPITDNAALQAHHANNSVQFAMTIKRHSDDARSATASAEHTKAPAIIIHPDGHLTPFVVTVSHADDALRYRVRGHAGGKIQLIPPRSKFVTDDVDTPDGT